MTVAIIDPLDPNFRALRTIQSPYHLEPVAGQATYRITSGAFIPGSDGTISVDLEESLRRAGSEVTAQYPSLDKAVALIAHPVRVYTNAGFTVVHQPVHGNRHHGSASTVLKNNALRKAARAFAASAEFLVPIDNERAALFGAAPAGADVTKMSESDDPQ